MGYTNIPKYTQYELSEMVKLKRKRYNWYKYDFCKYFDIEMHDLELIESATCSFSPKLYKICGKVLGIPNEELLANIEDNSIVTNNETYNKANYIFNEIILEDKTAR